VALLTGRSAEIVQRIRSNTTCAGRLVSLDIQVIHDERTKTCLLDFQVANQGSSELTIERVTLEVLDTQTIFSSSHLVSREYSSMFGFKKFSKVYGLDIVGLTKIGDRASCNVSCLGSAGNGEAAFSVSVDSAPAGRGFSRHWGSIVR
jgi:hypothetical protein